MYIIHVTYQYVYGQGEKNAQSLDEAFNSKYTWNIFTFLHTSPPHSLAFTLPSLLTLLPTSLITLPLPHPPPHSSPFTLHPYPLLLTLPLPSRPGSGVSCSSGGGQSSRRPLLCVLQVSVSQLSLEGSAGIRHSFTETSTGHPGCLR